MPEIKIPSPVKPKTPTTLKQTSMDSFINISKNPIQKVDDFLSPLPQAPKLSEIGTKQIDSAKSLIHEK